jgi:hypothetical protein
MVLHRAEAELDLLAGRRGTQKERSFRGGAAVGLALVPGIPGDLCELHGFFLSSVKT